MGRPSKDTAEWFPHYTDHGKTMFILESRYQNDGYSFWFKLLEILGNSQGHYFRPGEPANMEFLKARTGLAEEKIQEILDLLATLEAIDPELWAHGIVWSQNFVEGLKPLYDRRKVPMPERPSFCDGNTASEGVSDPETTPGEGFGNGNDGAEGVSGAETSPGDSFGDGNGSPRPQGAEKQSGVSDPETRADGSFRPGNSSTQGFPPRKPLREREVEEEEEREEGRKERAHAREESPPPFSNALGQKIQNAFAMPQPPPETTLGKIQLRLLNLGCQDDDYIDFLIRRVKGRKPQEPFPYFLKMLDMDDVHEAWLASTDGSSPSRSEPLTCPDCGVELRFDREDGEFWCPIPKCGARWRKGENGGLARASPESDESADGQSAEETGDPPDIETDGIDAGVPF